MREWLWHFFIGWWWIGESPFGNSGLSENMDSNHPLDTGGMDQLNGLNPLDSSNPMGNPLDGDPFNSDPFD